MVEESQTAQGTAEYKVKWVKAWEPAAYLTPKSGGTSPLIVDSTKKKGRAGTWTAG